MKYSYKSNTTNELEALQNLNSDVLCASNAKVTALGFRPHVSKREGLRRLAIDMGLVPNG